MVKKYTANQSNPRPDRYSAVRQPGESLPPSKRDPDRVRKQYNNLKSDEEKDRAYKMFAKAYIRIGTISGACSDVGINYKQMKRLLREEPYQTHFEEVVKERFADGLEAEALRRAMDKSDYLLGMVLKAHKREKYGDKVALGGEGGLTVPVKLVFTDTMLSPNEKKLLEGGSDG